MIQLKPDCLIFNTSDGEQIPCAAEALTLDLIGSQAMDIEPEIIHNASAAVLHYFKHELHQNFVSVEEFTQALQKVFRNLGLDPKFSPSHIPILECDLKELAERSSEGWELFFFPQVRGEMRRKLDQSPGILRFRNLRDCAKLLAGDPPRWNRRCQGINDQIVDYLRTCWSAEFRSQSCALVIL